MKFPTWPNPEQLFVAQVLYLTFIATQLRILGYIARKLSKDQLYSHLSILSELFTVIGHNKKQLEKAIALKASDFEDALQYQCAKEAHCNCIITRNQKDYTFSDIPVLSAEEFLEMVRPKREEETEE